MSDAATPILPVYGVTPFTLLDFPGRVACIIWFAGCNMRCGYCHNQQIVRSKGRFATEDVLLFLKKRQGLLDGIVLSGGEACAYKGLTDFIRQARRLGYSLKLDTNGLRPDILRDLLSEDLLDYIALDYKAPPQKFKKVTGTNKFDLFNESLTTLCGQKDIPFEVRTTVHTTLMDESDIGGIISDLDAKGYQGHYYIQNFRADNNRSTLKSLPPQARLLDASRLPFPRNFTLSFRNFPQIAAVS